jgi:hypothetical protein
VQARPAADTTDADLTAAASCTRRNPTTLLPTSPKRRIKAQARPQQADPVPGSRDRRPAVRSRLAGARLTLAGGQFCDDAKRLLELFIAARRRARQAARTASHFSVGFMPGVAVTPVIREFTESLPGADTSVVHTSPSNQVDYLLSGTVDACFVQLPISPRLFEIVPLFLESRVIALPAEHPFATQEGLSLEHFSGLDRVGLGELTPDPRSSGRGTGWSVPIEEQLERSHSDWGMPFFPKARPGSTTAVTYAIGISPGSMRFRWPWPKTKCAQCRNSTGSRA